MDKIDCVKCKSFTETKDVKTKTAKNNRQMLQGTCVVCGTKKSKFVSRKKVEKRVAVVFWTVQSTASHLISICLDTILQDQAQN